MNSKSIMLVSIMLVMYGEGCVSEGDISVRGWDGVIGESGGKIIRGDRVWVI